MLGGLGGDTAEFLGLELGDKTLAQLVGLAHALRVFQADLGVGVFHLFHNVPHQAGAEGTQFGVDVHDDVFILHLIVLLHGNDDGRLDLVDQVIGGQAAFLFQRGEGFKEFVVGCSSHFSGILQC